MNIDYTDIGLDWYQHEAAETAIYPEEVKIAYPVLGLVGEAGEIANKYKKVLRDNGGVLGQERYEAIVDELGDVLWYVAALATDLGIDLSAVAQNNLKKLTDRAQRGKLGGSGDTR